MYIQANCSNGNITIENDDIFAFSITRNATSSNNFSFGGCCISSFNCSFDYNNYKDYKFNNAILTLYDNDNKKKGVFYVDTPDINNSVISLECSDKLEKACVYWKGRSFPCTMWELYTNITYQININSGITKEDLPCANVIVNGSEDFTSITCKDLLSFIAELNGGFFYVNNNGDLVFKQFNFKNKKTYDESYINDTSIEQIETIRKGIILNINDVEYKFGATTNVMIIKENKILDTIQQDGIYFIGEYLSNIIKDIDYYGGNVSLWQEDTTIELGDIIEVIDYYGEYKTIIVHEISMENSFNYVEIESYGDDITTKATDSSSYSSSDSDYSSGRSNMGIGKNWQRIDAKQGTYTICEKTIKNISYFTHVFLSLCVEFYYDTGKVLEFKLYANNKQIGSTQKRVEVGLNTISVSFVSDVDLDNETCIYSCRVEIEEGCELIIEPYKAKLSLIIENGTIDKDIASDQKFIEKYEKVNNTIFNQKRFLIKELYEKVEMLVPEFIVNISKNDGESNVIGEYYESNDVGELVISGSGYMLSDSRRGCLQSCLNNQFPSTGSSYWNRIKNNCKKVIISEGVKSITSYTFLNCIALESITFPASLERVGSNYDENQSLLDKRSPFEGCASLQEITFEGGEVTIYGRVFENLTNLTTIKGEQYIRKIRAYAFKNSGLTGTFNFNNVISFYDGCFDGCTNVNRLHLPVPINISETKSIGAYCFANMPLLDEFIYITNELTDAYNGFYSSAFANSGISTFLISNDVDWWEFTPLIKVSAANKVCYIPSNDVFGPGGKYQAKTEVLVKNGFELIYYNPDEEQELVNQLKERFNQ